MSYYSFGKKYNRDTFKVPGQILKNSSKGDSFQHPNYSSLTLSKKGKEKKRKEKLI